MHLCFVIAGFARKAQPADNWVDQVRHTVRFFCKKTLVVCKRKIGPWICFFASHRHLALLTVDAVKAGKDGRLKVPMEMKADRLRNLLVGWLEVAMANIGRCRWEQGWKRLLISEEDWLDVAFDAQAEHAGGVLFQSSSP